MGRMTRRMGRRTGSTNWYKKYWIRASVVPGCIIELAEDAGPDKRSYRVNFEKIRRMLPGFQPCWDARMGAEQLYKAYKSSGLTLTDFEGPRYQRIAHIKKLLADGLVDNQLRYVNTEREPAPSPHSLVG